MNNEFSFKELYDVRLKSTYPIEINGQKIEAGESIAFFDKIRIANIDELKSRVAARGGFDNRAHVTWEDTKEITFDFTQGIFSKTQFAMMSNSRLITSEKEEVTIISQRQKIESQDDGTFELKYQPVGNIFIYNEETGERINDYTINGKVIDIMTPFIDVIVDYEFEYWDKATTMVVGRRLIEGYLILEGKTRVKDDITGHVKTGIIKIPRLKLMSDLSIRLGADANPIVGNFRAVGYPVGTKGTKEVMSLVFLNDDIDSDE